MYLYDSLKKAEVDNSSSSRYKESLDVVLINYFTEKFKKDVHSERSAMHIQCLPHRIGTIQLTGCWRGEV